MPITLAYLLASGSIHLWGAVIAIAAVGIIVFVIANPYIMFSFFYPLCYIVGQVPLPVGDSTISMERTLVVLGGAGIAIGIFLTRRLRLLRLPRFVAPGLLLWGGAYLLSLSVHPSEKGALLVFGFVQKAVLGYIAYICLSDSKRLQLAASMFLYASLLASFVTLYAYVEMGNLQFIRESSFLMVDESIGTAIFRGLARGGAGNTMAVWIALLFLMQSQGTRRYLWGTLVVWFFFLSLFALRREVLFTLPLGMAVMFFHKPTGLRHHAMAFGAVFLVFVIGFLMISPEWNERIFYETSEEMSSGTDQRITLLLRFTPTALVASPLIGHGPGRYEATQMQFPDQVTSPMLAIDGLASHNSWSSSAVEAGIFAFSGLCLFVYGIGRLLWSVRRTGNHSLDCMWSFTPLIFLQLMASMFFGDGITVSMTWYWFGFLIALEHTTRK